MGMTFEEDAAAKKRRELKERLVGKQEKVQPQQEYYINEFGEIIRNENNQQQGNSSSNNDDDLTDTVRTLAQFVTVAEKKAHVWKLVKYILLAYLGAALSITILPSAWSPFFLDHFGVGGVSILVYIIAIILVLLHAIGSYGKFYYLTENHENHFTDTKSDKFKIWLGIWGIFFLMLFIGSQEFVLGALGYIFFVTIAKFLDYRVSKYINDNNMTGNN